MVESFATMIRGRVSPVAIDDVLAAGRLANEHQGLSTRDLLHLAVMRRLGVSRVVTADAGQPSQKTSSSLGKSGSGASPR